LLFGIIYLHIITLLSIEGVSVHYSLLCTWT